MGNAAEARRSVLEDRPAGERGARTVELTKVYGSGDTAVRALDGVTVEFPAERFTAIMGQSGAGKSTLMHCAAGLDTATSGRVFVGGTELGGLSDRALTRLRRERIGLVFQAFNLVPTMTAADNITLPLTLAGRRPDPEWHDLVVRVLGLGNRLRHRAARLSGGQAQRVALARALVTRPDIVFADEPTGDLDSRTGAEVLTFLRRAVDDLGQTVAMATHDPVAAARADTVVFLADGRVADVVRHPTAAEVLDHMRDLGGRS
ncbi:ABC transporter ATP-binding protein [Actinomadura sp. NBRC 104425]|uniref:ABC transporter ATP-binding protein n=1 Tax=Actinomadura sp. NBRC 104425 TaxID=3032204 RepID=UPI0025576951|nr:ABC transporter ATP-binding protein [Actinomadura sp. NBRC 104425]